MNIGYISLFVSSAKWGNLEWLSEFENGLFSMEPAPGESEKVASVVRRVAIWFFWVFGSLQYQNTAPDRLQCITTYHASTTLYDFESTTLVLPWSTKYDFSTTLSYNRRPILQSAIPVLPTLSCPVLSS